MIKLKSLSLLFAVSISLLGLNSCNLFGGKVNKNVTTLDLFPVKSGEKFQYIDGEGKVVINPQFSDATVFRNGLALVKSDSKDPKYGYINKEGKMVINSSYKSATVFSEDIAWVVQEKGAPTAINTKGEVITTLSNASSVFNYKEGLAAFSVTDKNVTKWGFADKTGKVVINPQFKSTKSFSDGKCAVQNNDSKWGFIDKEGKIVINYQFDYAREFINGVAVVKSGDKLGTIDKEGKFIINPQFENIFYDGDIFLTIQGEKYGWSDKEGKPIINNQFDDAYPFGNNELAAVKSGKTWGYIDKKGKYQINLQFDDAYPFNGKLALVQSSGKYGFVDNKGKFVVNPQFDDVAVDLSKYVLDGNSNYDHVITDKQASDLADKKKVGETNSDDVNTSEIPGDAGVEDSEYVGTYAGQFGNYTIQLVIEDINGSEVSGYNVVAGNRRPVRGTVSNGSFELKEPGTDKWDGVFNFVVYNGVASGEWKANNGKAVTNFSILKKG
jgi:hypothetical protein